jgi:hypothetical protein
VIGQFNAFPLNRTKKTKMRKDGIDQIADGREAAAMDRLP